MKNEIIIYSPSEEIKIEVRLENDTIWLTQQQIANLFNVGQSAISKHLKNIYASNELQESSTYSILEYMGNNGKQLYKTKFYNLDAILSIGYRVNSVNATKFRQWANKVLKDYLLKGYSINQRFERLEQRVAVTENKIDFFVRTSLPPVEGIFYEGQICFFLSISFKKKRKPKKLPPFVLLATRSVKKLKQLNASLFLRKAR